MKLLLYIHDEYSDKSLFTNTWIDPNKITGFYFPTEYEDGIKCINLFFDGQLITVVQNEKIVDFLNNKFKVYDQSKIKEKRL